MRILMFILWGATVLPMAALLAWAAPAVAVRWCRTHWVSRAGLLLFWSLGACFLLTRPHDDSWTGLDNMAYRHLSHAFLDGRGFHDPDVVLASVPEALREDFLLHRGPVGRPTRDRVFSLSGWQSVETQPFFMPTLPLAAAAQSPVLAPERFVPLMGALWWAGVLAAGFCAGGGWGLVAVAALALGTAWPTWFLRGFYAEGVGALLVSGVVAAASVRPLRGVMTVVAGFALGMAVSYHPTMIMLSGPVALALWLERRELKTVLGLASGLLPFWALTRWVCQPYGDWTRWAHLKDLAMLAPEHEAIALVLVLLALGSIVALWAGYCPAVRSRIRRWDSQLNPWGWMAAFAMPFLLIVLLPPLAHDALRKAAEATWSGIRWPYALWIGFGSVMVLQRDRPIRERFCLVALCWGALLFLFVQGVETPVGLWSHRRFLPVILLGIGVLAAPMSARMSGISGRGWRALALALALLAGGANLVRWPVAFGGINEQGAEKWIHSIAERMGTQRRMIFDYYGHGVPYAAGLKYRVLGLGEPSRNHWPEVASWLSEVARHEEVWVATSWSPCTLEENARLEEVFAATGRFPIVRTKAFFPAEPGEHVVRNTFMRWMPLAPGDGAGQDKVLDGSPFGLRGPWGQIRRGATWTRQGSGILGPVPEKGGRARFEAECGWTPPTADWTEQNLRVTPPWGGEPLQIVVPGGEGRVEGYLTRPMEGGELPGTGVYSMSVERPYNPAEYGLRGYASDLGVSMRRIIIRIEPGGSSVSE